jgi:hypothetical protein
MDGSTNWGDYDSVWLYVGDEDTSAPSFVLTVTPSPALIGDTVDIRAEPDELLHPDSAVFCSVGALDDTTYTLTLAAAEDYYVGALSTAGFVPGEYSVTVCGYDIWSNRGCSATTFRVDEGGEFLPEEMVYVWPSPVNGDTVHFHFYVNANADVTVEVFSLEGKRMAYLEGRGEGGREPHQESSNAIDWNAKQVASDVYIYRLHAVSDVTGEKAYAVGKFAVVR